MSEATKVRAVVFAKDLGKVAGFYAGSLDMECLKRDEYHAVLGCRGFELIVHQIPDRIAADIEIDAPPVRREGGAVRLDYPVDNIDRSRASAKSFGGHIDESPPEWADRDTNFYPGFDPEGNVFGVSQLS